MTDPVALVFCQQELPDLRYQIRTAADQARHRCKWIFRTNTSTAQEARAHILSSSPHHYSINFPAYSGYSPDKTEGESDLRAAPMIAKDALISQGDIYDTPLPATLEHCDVYENSAWTFERLGPFTGEGGSSWFSAGWPDVGLFHDRLLVAHTWVTAFGFAPINSGGQRIGLPPLHMHHMHVTSHQTAYFWMGLATTSNSSPFSFRPPDEIDLTHGTEFDMHGDRQCRVSSGGTDCLIRELPLGFGIKINSAMETFYDLNDVRPSGSPPLVFFTEHAFRWTNKIQRGIKHYTAGGISNIRPESAYNGSKLGTQWAWHDDTLLIFEPYLSEYVWWSENQLHFNGEIVRTYWHAHHAYTRAAWLIQASPYEIGLSPAYGVRNVTATGQSLQSAMTQIAKQTYTAHKKVVCSMEVDVRESINGTKYDRYNLPQCDKWDATVGLTLTIVAFFSAEGIPSPMSKVWAHITWYGLYTYKEY